MEMIGTFGQMSVPKEGFFKRKERLLRKTQAEKQLDEVTKKRREIKEALRMELVYGHIDEARYTILADRMDDIADDLIIFGKDDGVLLAKTYVCGIINKGEFDRIKRELIPPVLTSEREYIEDEVRKLQDFRKAYRTSCNKDEGVCQKCRKDARGVFTRLYQVDGMALCKVCMQNYMKHKRYEGFQGVYLVADPCDLDDIHTPHPHVSIRPEYL